MAYPSSTFAASSWAYWPSSDRYHLAPKWEEYHADQDRTARPDDEPNRLTLVGDWWSNDVYFDLALRDTSDPDNVVVPEDEPQVFTRIYRTDGWMTAREMPVELVRDTVDDVPDTWTGDLRIRIDESMREWLSYGVIAHFTIDVLFPTHTDRIRVGYGTVLLRR